MTALSLAVTFHHPFFKSKSGSINIGKEAPRNGSKVGYLFQDMATADRSKAGSQNAQNTAAKTYRRVYRYHDEAVLERAKARTKTDLCCKTGNGSFVPHSGHCGRLRLHLQSAEKKVEVELCGSSDSDASFGDILGAALKSDD